MLNRISKRRKPSRKQKEFINSVLFLAVSLLSVAGLLIYLWVYNEIILTEKSNDGLQYSKEDLSENNRRLRADIARLMRADRITSIAEEKLDLVTPIPESLVVFIEKMTPNNIIGEGEWQNHSQKFVKEFFFFEKTQVIHDNYFESDDCDW